MRGDNRRLENLKIDLENHVEVIQEKLTKVENVGGDELKANLQKIVGEYEKNYKPTSRDWTKARQLLNELKKLI